MGNKNKHSVIQAIKRLKDKKIKFVPNPLGPQRQHYYALMEYQSCLTPYELQALRKLKDIKNPKLVKILEKKAENIGEQLEQALVLAEIFLPIEAEDNPQLKKELQRLMKGPYLRHGVTFKELKYMILLSETILTKNHVCNKFGITPQAFEQNIKRHNKLQLLRQRIREEKKKAEKINAIIIPVYRNEQLMIGVVKNSIARKYGVV